MAVEAAINPLGLVVALLFAGRAFCSRNWMGFKPARAAAALVLTTIWFFCVKFAHVGSLTLTVLLAAF
jgi:hypothetical protein